MKENRVTAKMSHSHCRCLILVNAFHKKTARFVSAFYSSLKVQLAA